MLLLVISIFKNYDAPPGHFFLQIVRAIFLVFARISGVSIAHFFRRHVCAASTKERRPSLITNVSAPYRFLFFNES